MLSAAKPKLQTDIEKLLYDAMYEAFKSTYNSNSSVDSKIDGIAKKEIEDAAKKFADKASKKAAKPFADAIYNFVKQIGIMATPKGTLVSPMGPVSGSILMTDFTIS